MPEVERKVTETNSAGVNESGEVVKERTQRVETKTNAKTAVVNFVWYIYGLFTFLLGIRMFLKLFGANSANGFVDLIYSVSGVLSAPFDSIFGVTTAEAGNTESVFEPSILVAIAVYALIAWGIAKLLTLNENQ
jgi:hypothetical protein